jgi:hypothetical protein
MTLAIFPEFEFDFSEIFMSIADVWIYARTKTAGSKDKNEGESETCFAIDLI